MKKKTVLKLVRYHSENNETNFKDAAYELAKELDEAGDYELAEYVMAQVSDANTFSQQ